MAASPQATVKAGVKELVAPGGIAGMTGGVIGAPLARTAVYDAMPNVFRDGSNANTWQGVYLLGQGVLGGAAAAGRLAGRGALPRAVGAGAAVEAARSLLAKYLDV